MNTQAEIVIGCGAGFAGDRADAALPVIAALGEYDCPRYLIYEVLAERTLAIAQKIKLNDSDKGYSPWLDLYLNDALALCLEHGVRIVSNFGSANPLAAARRIQTIAREKNLRIPTVACVLGDDLLQSLSASEIAALPAIEGIANDGSAMIAANAYLGARPIANALATQADIVVVGRTTDSALVLGPLLHEFGWSDEQLDLLAAGIMGGHLIECGSQVTGGYFADPGYKDVPGLDATGFPLLEMTAQGEITVTKPAGSGGLVNRQTVTEQLLYEIHDPERYLTPDVVLDLSEVELRQTDTNRVELSGARGSEPPTTLKATLCYDAGWLGEAEITYAGPNSLARAELAAETLRSRMSRRQDPGDQQVRVEILGLQAVFDDNAGSQRELAQHTAQHQSETDANNTSTSTSGEYRVRAALRSQQKETAKQVADEVLALYCCGPAGGGGVRQSVTQQVTTSSVLVPRNLIDGNVRVELLEA